MKWIPRELNCTADLLSKYIDADDWSISYEFFNALNGEWGPFTVDRFANGRNKKTHRFFAKFFEKGCEGVDAFLYSWENEINLLVPPIALLHRVIKKIGSERVRGTLVVPFWPSADFWPFLRSNGGWAFFVAEYKIFPQGKKFLVPSSSPIGLH